MLAGVDVSRVTRQNRAEPQVAGAPPKRRPNVVEPTHHKHTMKKLLFVGMDVHAQSITLALAPGRDAEVRLYGSIPHNLQALAKVFGTCGVLVA